MLPIVSNKGPAYSPAAYSKWTTMIFSACDMKFFKGVAQKKDTFDLDRFLITITCLCNILRMLMAVQMTIFS